MTTFHTPERIHATIGLAAGDVRVAATDGTETRVEVEPARADRPADRRAAENTVVEFQDGQLLVRTPHYWRRGSMFNTGIVRVSVTLPAGSRLQCDTGIGSVVATGELGITTVHSGVGTIRLERTGQLRADTTKGDVMCEDADGDVGVSCSAGDIRIGRIDGAASLRTSKGNVEAGEITGPATLRSSNGNISLRTAGQSLSAKTAKGSVRVEMIASGSAKVATSVGNITVGIAPGTAAWLDLHTSYGSVRNQLKSTIGPESTGQQASISAQTSNGDIDILRAAS